MDMANPIVNTMAIRCQTSSNWLPIKDAIVKASATLTNLSRTISVVCPSDQPESRQTVKRTAPAIQGDWR